MNLKTTLLALTIALGGVMTAGGTEIRVTYATGKQTNNMGAQTAKHYDVAMHLTDADYVGAKVAGVHVMLAWNTTYGTANYKVWAATSLDDELQPIGETDLTIDRFDGEAMFTTPIEIPEGGLYIGYSFDIPKTYTEEEELALGKWTRFPVPTSGATASSDVFWVKPDNAGWYDYTKTYGAAPIEAILTDPFKPIALDIQGVYGAQKAGVNEPINIAIEFMNKSALRKVSSIDYNYTIGSKSGTGHVECYNPVRPGNFGHALIELPYMSTTGRKNFTIEITKINGEKNQTTGGHKVEGAVFVAKALKRGLMEEQTGTWCGFCVRGALAMRELKNRNPQFLGIAYHANDCMSVPTSDLPFTVPGYPGCRLDRKKANIDPATNELGPDIPDPYNGYLDESEFKFGMEPLFARLVEEPGYAAINIDTEWNADQTELSAHTTVNFSEMPENGPFKLAYVLLQNGVCNPSDVNFDQHNYYGIGTNARYDGDLRQELCEQPQHILDYVYNDVAIYARDAKGIAGSLPADAETEEDYTHDYHINLADAVELDYADESVYIQDPDEMELVAIILDKNNEVINARSVKAGYTTDVNKSGIIETAIDAQDCAPVYYDLQGRQVMNPQRGLFIKRQGNKTTKVIL